MYPVYAAQACTNNIHAGRKETQRGQRLCGPVAEGREFGCGFSQCDAAEISPGAACSHSSPRKDAGAVQ